MRPDDTGYVRIVGKIQNMEAKGKMEKEGCVHLSLVQDVIPSALGCEDCLKIGDRWVHLRVCLICGHVGCCDNSKNRHATRHYNTTRHPVIASFEPGEDWLWCYPDENLITP